MPKLAVFEKNQLFGEKLSKQKSAARKLSLPVLLIIGFAIGVAAPFWFTGGFVSHTRLVKNSGLSMGSPGWGLGSKTLFVREGQTIEVEVEMHAVNEGALQVFISPNQLTSFKKRDSALKRVGKTGKTIVSLKANQTGFYRIKFSPLGDYESKLDVLSGGKCDLSYSASWDVL